MNNIEKNSQLTDDKYNIFTEIFEREKNVLLEHSSNLEKLFSEKNNYNFIRLSEETSTINKLVCSKYDSLLQKINEDSQKTDSKFTSTNEDIKNQYSKLTYSLKTTIDDALIESNNNYEVAQKKIDRISLFNKILIVLNCLILIAVIFIIYSS